MSYLVQPIQMQGSIIRQATSIQTNVQLNKSVVGVQQSQFQQVKSVSSVIKTPNGINQVFAQAHPQTKISIQNIPIQKFYTDYEPVVSHQHVAYEREYEEQHQTSLGVSVPVTRTMTDYQTLQITNFRPIQVPYTDYQQIEYKSEYIPRIRYEIVTEHIPTSQIDQILEQHPYKAIHTQDNGQQVQVLELVTKQKNVPKSDFITQQRVNQIVEYEEIQTQRVISDSTVLCPIVFMPPQSQVVVQQSIHEPQLNQPDVQYPNYRHEQKIVTLQNTQDNFYQVQPQEFYVNNNITPQKSGLYKNGVQNK